MAEKISTLILKVDLNCPRCYKKIKKVLCKFKEIRDQVFDEKQNTITISGPFCPHKMKKKLCCKACKIIKSIEIKEPPKPKPKPPPEKPVEKPAPPPPAPAPKPAPPPEPKPAPPPPPEPKPAPPPPPEPKPAPPPPPEPKPAPPPAPKPAPAPEPVCAPAHPIGFCCGECYGGRGGGPCYMGYGRPPPCYPDPPVPEPVHPSGFCCGECYEGRGGGPCYIGYGGNRGYGSSCDYVSEENPLSCMIM